METLFLREITFRSTSDLAKSIQTLSAINKVIERHANAQLKISVFRGVSGNPLKVVWVLPGDSVDAQLEVSSRLAQDPEYLKLTEEIASRSHTDKLEDHWLVRLPV